MTSDIRETWSAQYQLPCVCVEDCDRIEAVAVIAFAEGIGAIRRDDGIEYCVELREEIGPELWTEESLRRSCGKRLPKEPTP